jgi:exosortase B
MSALFGVNSASAAATGRDWLPVAAALLVLYVPTFYGAATTFWETEENAHGPIILAVIIWLIWTKRAALFSTSCRPAPIAGIVILVAGLLLYVIGRAMDVALFEIGALAPILAGTVLAMRGSQTLRAFWFPLFFIVFMVPLPGTLTDALTGPLKQHVSVIAEHILYSAGYPIARNGVTLTVGQYQLLVADACSGLNTMFSLSALGMLFMHLMSRTSVLHNAVMLASILPIAFVANVIRVLVLILVTYHFGDEAGQGYLHGSAGIVLLVVSLVALLVLDGVLSRIIRPRPKAPARHA